MNSARQSGPQEPDGAHVPGMSRSAGDMSKMGLFPVDEADIKHANFYREALEVAMAKKRPMSRRERVEFIANAIYWTFFLCIAAWVFSQIYDRRVPSDFHSVEAINPTLHAGQELRVQYDIERHRACMLSYIYSVRDSAGESHTVGPFDVGLKSNIGADTFTKSYLMRSTWATGPADFHVEFRYKCPGNYVQAFAPIVWTGPTIAIKILPPVPGTVEGSADTLQDH